MLEETKLKTAKKELIEYATFVEQMLAKSIRGLRNKDRKLLQEVITEDEPRANDLEISFDELCIRLIAQHQPAGKALRTILMIANINSNLERMADHADGISQSALYLIDQPDVKPLIDIPAMAEIVSGMIRDSISAFINEDAPLANAVCEKDNTVDGLRNQIVRELITFMMADSSTIERALKLMNIANNLERVADLTTNICEDVIYMVKGKITKHHRDEI